MNKRMRSNSKSVLLPGDFPPVVSGIATYFHEIWKVPYIVYVYGSETLQIGYHSVLARCITLFYKGCALYSK